MGFLENMPEVWQFFIQLAIVLVCLFYGARKGGITLGLLGGIGLIILVFGFHMQPGKPAIDVMLVILAVVTASATLQASGGLDVMLQIAEKILRKHPKMISFLAPVVTCTLTVLCGTGHVVYTMLPIVYDIAIKNGIRPERPMAASSVGAQMGIIASPVSVAVVSLTAFLINADSHLAGFDGYVDLLKITIPSTYCGIFFIGLYSWFRGKDLDKDEVFQEKIKDPEFRDYVYGSNETLLDKTLPGKAWAAMWIFLGTIAVVAVLGYVKELRPAWGKTDPATIVQIVDKDGKVIKSGDKDLKFEIKDGSFEAKVADTITQSVKGGKGSPKISYNELKVMDKDGNVKQELKFDGGSVTLTDGGNSQTINDAKITVANTKSGTTRLSMTYVIQIFMLLAGALMIIFTKPNVSDIGKNEVFRSGMIALVAVYGISWMVETMFGAHIGMLKESLGQVIIKYPWTYALMLLLISKFVNSQAAAIAAFVPIALSIGVSPAVILAFAPACYGYYILPTYPSDLAAIQFDRSGTTHIGKYVINHSFILPGLIGVISSCIVGYILAGLFGYL